MGDGVKVVCCVRLWVGDGVKGVSAATSDAPGSSMSPGITSDTCFR